MKTQITKRMLAVILSLVLTFGAVPVAAVPSMVEMENAEEAENVAKLDLVTSLDILSKTSELQGIVTRDDGTWLFPVAQQYYQKFSDWCCCPGYDKCVLCNSYHSEWGDSAHSGQKGHNGIDLATPTGTPVYAAADGIFYKGGSNSDSRGFYIVIEHPIGNNLSYYSGYQHLSEYNEELSDGQNVKAGDLIGKTGGSGANSGVHLHFGIVIGNSGKGRSGLNTYELWGSSNPWATKPEQTQGRIINNPADNFPTSEAGATLAAIKAHAGSVHYTFDKTKVDIGSPNNSTDLYPYSSAYKSSKYYTALNNVEMTGDEATDLVNVALSQVGYHEGNNTSELGGSNASGTNNYSEYGYWFGTQVKGNTTGHFYDWCAMFVSWCARQAGISTSTISNSAYAKAENAIYKFANLSYFSRGNGTPKKGDLIFFDNPNVDGQWDHVGIVESVTSTQVKTIEGNAGEQVKKITYNLTDTCIQGYGRPNYKNVSVDYATLSNGSYTLSNSGYYLNMAKNTETETEDALNASQSAANKTFTITREDDFYIISAESGKCLNVWGDNSSDGARVSLYHNTKGDAVEGAGYRSQRWYFEECEGGYYIHPVDVPSLYLTRDSSSNNIYVKTKATDTKYQVWSVENINKRTISFNPNGGTVSPETKTVVSGEKYGDLPTPSRDGYTFNGWYTATSGGTKITSDTTVNLSANQTLYAQWAANTYTVSFNAAGGSVSTTSKTVTNGSTYGTLPTPTRTGYRFDGWYTTVSGGTNITSSTIVNLTEDQTLYARWYLNRYTVSYDANGGTGAPSAQTKTHGVALTLSTQKPTRDGYTFKGWAKSANGSVAYAPGASFTIDTGIVLYAVWEGVTKNYTVTFNAAGGSVSTTSKTVTNGSTYGTLPTPTRTGYRFDGWYTTVSGGTKITSSTIVNLTEDQTLYARWYLNRYTVSYDANGGTDAPSAQTKTHGTALTISTQKPMRSGYTFVGWALTETATSAQYVAGASFTLEQDTTLYAVWKKNNNTPTIPETDALIKVVGARTRAGKTVDVKIDVSKNPGIVFAKFKVTFPNALTLKNVSDGGIWGSSTHSNNLSSPYTLYWNNGTATSDFTANGTIVTLTFEVSETAADGDYAISVEVDKSSTFNYADDPVGFAVENGKITVVSTIIGDINGDGEVNARDERDLSRHIAGWTGYDTIDEIAADVNCDGEVNARDERDLSRHIAGWTGYDILPKQ